MWPFSTPRRDRRVDELQDKVEQLERQMKMLGLEWESVYNKVRSILARLNKRDEREEEALAAAHPPGNGSRALPPSAPSRPAPRIPGPTERGHY